MIRRNTGQGGAACRSGLFCACRTYYRLLHNWQCAHYCRYSPRRPVLPLAEHHLDCAAKDMPCRAAARRSFSGARHPTSVAQPPSRVFNRLRRRCAPLTGTNPRWCRAQMRQKKGGPPRRRSYTCTSCALIVRRPLKTRASRRRRALTGRHGYGYDAAHRARLHQREEPV
jgi:hypothetical protein